MFRISEQAFPISFGLVKHTFAPQSQDNLWDDMPEGGSKTGIETDLSLAQLRAREDELNKILIERLCGPTK